MDLIGLPLHMVVYRSRRLSWVAQRPLLRLCLHHGHSLLRRHHHLRVHSLPARRRRKLLANLTLIRQRLLCQPVTPKLLVPRCPQAKELLILNCIRFPQLQRRR